MREIRGGMGEREGRRDGMEYARGKAERQERDVTRGEEEVKILKKVDNEINKSERGVEIERWNEIERQR